MMTVRLAKGEFENPDRAEISALDTGPDEAKTRRTGCLLAILNTDTAFLPRHNILFWNAQGGKKKLVKHSRRAHEFRHHKVYNLVS
jgi:hypothetical protein